MKKVIQAIVVSAIVALAVMGCKADEDEVKITTHADTPSVSVPSLQIGVPNSLEYTTTSQSANFAGDGFSAAVTTETDTNGCPTLNGGEDFFENGYSMTKFLVVLSENQACYADLFISAAAENLGPFIGLGKISLDDSTGLTGFQFDLTDTTYQLWFWFNSETDPSFYLTWTGDTSSDASGQFINKYLYDASSDISAVRFDFSRSASIDENKIYVEYDTDGSSDIEGFHSEVSRTVSGTDTTYSAKGIIGFTTQFTGDLTTDVDFTPTLSMVTVSDDNGKGASIASYQDVAIHIQDASNDVDMGTYRYTLTDKVYFTSDGTTEWKYKDITDASYVGNADRSGTSLAIIIACLESSACPGESITLGDNYFTDTCATTDGADCTTFMQAVYDEGWGGNYDNSDTDEPTSDSRYEELNQSEQLTAIWPSGTTKGSDDFLIPSP